MSTRHPPRALALIAFTLAACGRSTPPDPGPAVAPAAPATPILDAEVVSQAARIAHLDKGRLIPLPSADTLWGISIPIGCRARRVRPRFVRFDCRPGQSTLQQFYQYRFPGLRVTEEGLGVVVRGGEDEGYARVQLSKLGRASLTIYRHRAGAGDPVHAKLQEAFARFGGGRGSAPRPRRRR